MRRPLRAPWADLNPDSLDRNLLWGRSKSGYFGETLIIKCMHVCFIVSRMILNLPKLAQGVTKRVCLNCT